MKETAENREEPAAEAAWKGSADTASAYAAPALAGLRDHFAGRPEGQAAAELFGKYYAEAAEKLGVPGGLSREQLFAAAAVAVYRTIWSLGLTETEALETALACFSGERRRRGDLEQTGRPPVRRMPEDPPRAGGGSPGKVRGRVFRRGGRFRPQRHGMPLCGGFCRAGPAGTCEGRLRDRPLRLRGAGAPPALDEGIRFRRPGGPLLLGFL